MRRSGSDSTKLLGPFDLWLILLFILAAFLAFLYMHYHVKEGRTVTVTVDGMVYGSWPLDSEETIVIEPEPAGADGSGTESFKNVLRISNGQAKMTEADCPDKICIGHKPINRTGETIVCLPHKVVVEITGDEAYNGDSEKEFDVIVH